MKAMSVIHICNLPLPAGHPDYGRMTTHPGRWVLNLALAQKAHAGLDPSLVVQVPGASADYTESIEGIPVHFLAAPDRLRSATFFFFDVRRIARRVKNLSPALVHAHGTEDAYALAAQATGLPCILTAQGCFFTINRQLRPKLISRATVVQFTERRALIGARHVIAKSAYVREELKGEFPHLQIHEIPNTFDPRLLEIDPADRRDPRAVAFVGTIEPRKGFDLLVSAVEILLKTMPGLKLHVFGNRPGEGRDFEARELERARGFLGDRLILHGTIPALEVAEKVAECAVLAAPSREEMFGNQVIEAILVGTPVVVADETAMAENVRRYRGGTVVPQEDPASLATALEPFLNGRGENAPAGRSLVSEAMGPAVVAAAHRRVYEEILHGGK